MKTGGPLKSLAFMVAALQWAGSWMPLGDFFNTIGAPLPDSFWRDLGRNRNNWFGVRKSNKLTFVRGDRQ